MCHINGTAVTLQEISQFVVNINTKERENLVKAETRSAGFASKAGWGLAAGLEPCGDCSKAKLLGTKMAFFCPRSSGVGSALTGDPLSCAGLHPPGAAVVLARTLPPAFRTNTCFSLN